LKGQQYQSLTHPTICGTFNQKRLRWESGYNRSSSFTILVTGTV
jgi:hypothetical protein